MSGYERDISILRHIHGYCVQIEETVARFGDDFTVFRADFVYRNAVAMCLLQIGELAGHLSEEYRNEHTQMPWRQIKALRNIIAHNYGSVVTAQSPSEKYGKQLRRRECRLRGWS